MQQIAKSFKKLFNATRQSSSSIVNLIFNDESQYEPFIFEKITGDVIREAANRIKGSIGPSAFDEYLWCRFFLLVI
jgi:hypothetical protein